MTPDLIAKYEGLRVPRYTSYPTAPHFTADIGPVRTAQWLAALKPDTELSLYFHVPFCHAMCWYCGCHTKVVARYEPVAAYARLLERELDLVARALGQRFTVRHVHWGGGTPTILSTADFTSLMDRVRRHFTMADSAEIAAEIDPRTLDRDQCQGLAAAGVTRASLGVQDFDIEVQRRINRVQSYETTLKVAQWLNEAGIKALNLDLMYGLPTQTIEACRDTARRALTLNPGRLAVFGYAHVPWMKRHQRMIDEAELPDTATRWRQFDAIRAVMEANGYRTIGLDHFAAADDALAKASAAGTLHRNFQGYTTDEAEVLIGLGASAIGSLPQGYVQNAPALHDYEAALAADTLPIVKGVAVDADDLMRRDLIERLMCDLQVDTVAVAQRHGAEASVFTEDLNRLSDLVDDGLAEIDGTGRVTVPDAARPLVRAVAAAFDRHLHKGLARHSKAI